MQSWYAKSPGSYAVMHRGLRQRREELLLLAKFVEREVFLKQALELGR